MATEPVQMPMPMTPKDGQEDPSVLTTAMIDKALIEARRLFDAQLDVLRQRLDGDDKATQLRLKSIDHMPERIDEKIRHLEELTAVKFEAVDQQFVERDTRSERESKDNKVAMDAAFAAQKEAAAKQDEANQKAIDKSEVATNKTIDQLQTLVNTSLGALRDQLDNVKEAVAATNLAINTINQTKAGSREGASDSQADAARLRAVIGFGIMLILAAITIVGFVLSGQQGG